MESLFQGDIEVYPKISTGEDLQFQPSWLDIIKFAASHPVAFNLAGQNAVDGDCVLSLKGVNLHITWNDWRLIKSDVLSRFGLAPAEPLEEDERTELATIDIVEARVQVILEKIGEIAANARQLIHLLNHRRVAIAAHAQGELKLDAGIQAHVLQQILSQTSQYTCQQATISGADKSGSSLSPTSPSGFLHPPTAATPQSILQPVKTLGAFLPLGQEASDLQISTMLGTYWDSFQEGTGPSYAGYAWAPVSSPSSVHGPNCEWTTALNHGVEFTGTKMSREGEPGKAVEVVADGRKSVQCPSPAKPGEASGPDPGHPSNKRPTKQEHDADTDGSATSEATVAAEDGGAVVGRRPGQSFSLGNKRQKLGDSLESLKDACKWRLRELE